jgi:general secretion pathway protein K
MGVEAALARNAANDRRIEWLCRSGVELARYMVGQQFAEQREPYDALNQRWAGGPGTLEDCVLNAVNLKETGLAEGSPLWFLLNGEEDWENYLSEATLKVKIVDLERKMNINWVAQGHHDRESIKPVMQEVLKIENTVQDTIIDSLVDWVDLDDDPRINGMESREYEPFGYSAKNGLIDDMSELLLINGIRGEREWLITRQFPGDLDEEFRPRMFIPDLFTVVSRGKINVNTAPIEVLQMVSPSMMDYTNQILLARQGEDAIEGTEFDTPFQQIGELADPRIGMDGNTVSALSRFLDVRSMTFEVTVTAVVENQAKTLVAVVRRENGREEEIKILYSYWKDSGR